MRSPPPQRLHDGAHEFFIDWTRDRIAQGLTRLNPLAVARPVGHWGNAGRNSIIGPDKFGLNASMSRTFRFSDRVNADFRLDASNVLNHVTFPSWNTVITSSQFGLPTTANAMRSVLTTFRVRF